MKLYKTFATDKETGSVAVSFQGSLTESSQARSAAKKDGKKAETQTIEVPTSKGPLLDWLNANVKA
jgi:hypothetical protein